MKKNYSQEIFIISILTLTITVLWVYLSIHRALKKSESPILTPQETRILNPQLDESVFEQLKERKI
jgi:hypothetical protein